MNNTLWNIFTAVIVIIHIPELMWYYISVAYVELKMWWIERGGDI